jgi:hypothetical protein
MDMKARRALDHHRLSVDSKDGEAAVEEGVIVTCRRLLRHIDTIRVSPPVWLHGACG